MKQKDVALIIIIAFVSAVISFLVSGRIFVTPENRQQQVEVVDKISPEFLSPSKTYFNSTSINPTVNPNAMSGTNQNPFNGTSADQ